MPDKFYPIILAAISTSDVHIEIVKSQIEYAAFYSRFTNTNTEFKEIKTLEALYMEGTAKLKR